MNDCSQALSQPSVGGPATRAAQVMRAVRAEPEVAALESRMESYRDRVALCDRVAAEKDRYRVGQLAPATFEPHYKRIFPWTTALAVVGTFGATIGCTALAYSVTHSQMVELLAMQASFIGSIFGSAVLMEKWTSSMAAARTRRDLQQERTGLEPLMVSTRVELDRAYAAALERQKSKPVEETDGIQIDRDSVAIGKVQVPRRPASASI